MHIKYPRSIAFILLWILAFVLFFDQDALHIHELLAGGGYFTIILIGMMYVYGFTAPVATALLLILAQDYALTTIVVFAGMGAIISDILLFLFIRDGFAKEIEQFSQEKPVRSVEETEERMFGTFHKYMHMIYASILIASPLPTELGISILASIKQLSVRTFILIAGTLHIIGITLIIYIGTVM